MRIDYNAPKDAAEKSTGGADDRQQAEMGDEEGEEGEEAEGGIVEGEGGADTGGVPGAIKKRSLVSLFQVKYSFVDTVLGINLFFSFISITALLYSIAIIFVQFFHRKCSHFPIQ